MYRTCVTLLSVYAAVVVILCENLPIALGGAPRWELPAYLRGGGRGGTGAGGPGYGGHGGPGGSGYGGPAIGGTAIGGGVGGNHHIRQAPNGGPVFVGPVYGAPAYGGNANGGNGYGGRGGNAGDGYGGYGRGGNGYGRRMVEAEEISDNGEAERQLQAPVYVGPSYLTTGYGYHAPWYNSQPPIRQPPTNSVNEDSRRCPEGWTWMQGKCKRCPEGLTFFMKEDDQVTCRRAPLL